MNGKIIGTIAGLDVHARTITGPSRATAPAPSAGEMTGAAKRKWRFRHIPTGNM
jgi:hypothetical protein